MNDLSSEIITPILPIFITALGGSGIVVGLVGGLRDGIAGILKVFCGYWSDRIGKRKVFVRSGYLFSAVFKLFLSLSKTCQQILVFASFERVGKGLRTAPRDAIIADSIPHERGRGFGIHRAFDTSGAILGSVIVFVLFWFLGFSFRTIIFIAAILAFFSLIPLHFVRDKKREAQNINFKIGFKNLSRRLKLFIIVSSLFALANFSYMFFILRAQEFFLLNKNLLNMPKLAVGVPILFYVLFNIFYAGLAIPFGKLSDRIGKKKVLIFGYFLFSLTSLGFALFNSIGAFVILFIFYGIVYAIIEGNQRAYIADLSSAETRATALGTFHTAIGLAALPASLIAGFLWQNIASNAAFIYGSAVSAIAAVLFFTFKL